MGSKVPSPSSPSSRFLEWRTAYQAALKETDTATLFKCVEVAEAAVLTRRADLQRSSGHEAERREIEEALDSIQVLKRERLRFDDGSRPEVARGESERGDAPFPETE